MRDQIIYIIRRHEGLVNNEIILKRGYLTSKEFWLCHKLIQISVKDDVVSESYHKQLIYLLITYVITYLI